MFPQGRTPPCSSSQFVLLLVKAGVVSLDEAEIDVRAWRNGSRNGLKIRWE